MRFAYTPHYTSEGVVYTPRVNVCLTHPIRKDLIVAFGLVDSGAEDTLIHEDIGKALGIAIETGVPVLYRGIGGTMKAYRHRVLLRLIGSKTDFEIECGFAPLKGIDALLGGKGFFDHYKVVFEKYKKMFSATERKVRRH